MDDGHKSLNEGLWPLLERSFDGVLIVEPGPWRVMYANPAISRWLAIAATDLVGQAIEGLFNTASTDDILGELDATLNGKSSDEPLLAALVRPRKGVEIVSIRTCR